MIEQYLEKAIAWLESGALWVQGQIPLYIEELIRWKIAEAIFGITLGVVFLIVAIIVYKLTEKAYFASGVRVEPYHDTPYIRHKEDIRTWHLLTGGSAVIGILFIMISTLCLLQVAIAPRVYLLNYLREML